MAQAVNVLFALGDEDHAAGRGGEQFGQMVGNTLDALELQNPPPRSFGIGAAPEEAWRSSDGADDLEHEHAIGVEVVVGDIDVVPGFGPAVLVWQRLLSAGE